MVLTKKDADDAFSMLSKNATAEDTVDVTNRRIIFKSGGSVQVTANAEKMSGFSGVMVRFGGLENEDVDR